MVGVGSYNGNTCAAHFPSLQVELRTCLGEALISIDAPQRSIEGPGLKYSHVCDGASAWVSAESDRMVGVSADLVRGLAGRAPGIRVGLDRASPCRRVSLPGRYPHLSGKGTRARRPRKAGDNCTTYHLVKCR
jgi:hypothetical protein